MGPEVAVGEQQHHGRGQDGEGDEDQDGGDEHVPGEDRQPEHGHARGPQVEGGRHQVDGGEDGREPGEGDPEDPQVGRRAR